MGHKRRKVDQVQCTALARSSHDLEGMIDIARLYRLYSYNRQSYIGLKKRERQAMERLY